MEQQTDLPPLRQKIRVKEILQTLGAFLFLGALIFFSLKIIGSEELQQKIAGAGVFGPLLFMLLKAGTIIIAPLGGNPLYLIAERLWGFSSSFIYLFSADTVAYIVIFFLSRRFGRKIIRYFVTDKDMHKVDDVLERFGTWKYFLIARFLAQEFAGYAAGLTKIPFSHYIAIVVFANVVNTTLLLFIGHAFVVNRTTFFLTLVALSFIPAIVASLWHTKRKNAVTLNLQKIAEDEKD